MSRHRTRRRFLTAAAAALGGLGLASTTDADDHRSYVLEQDGDCYPVVPLSGEKSVEAFYEWDLSDPSYSSEGTRDLQESETSLLFLYRGPAGLSLVVVHDKADDETPGGKVSFEIQGIPGGATWAVKDDLYDLSSNIDTWEINETVLEANESTITDDYNVSDDDNETTADDNDTAPDGDETTEDGNETAETTRTDEIDWWWTTGRTDGGALRGLAVDDLELRIEPAFNDDAELADKPTEDEDPNEGEITSWELLSGDREDPDRTALDLEEPVTLRTGSCGGVGSTAGDATATADEANSTETEDADNRTDEDGEAGTEEADDGDDGEETDDGEGEEGSESESALGPSDDAGPPDHANAPGQAGPPDDAGPE